MADDCSRLLLTKKKALHLVLKQAKSSKFKLSNKITPQIHRNILGSFVFLQTKHKMVRKLSKHILRKEKEIICSSQKQEAWIESIIT